MLFRSLKIGRIAGFDIEVNTSFLILLGLVIMFQGIGAGLTIAVVVFGSVLLHELGHSIAARRRGVPIAGIELHFFGGVAKMTRNPRSPRDEIIIAAAGPAVSFALAGVGLIGAILFPFPTIRLFAGVNTVLGVFNLLPALPMDGGRIFRAALSKKLGRLRATQIAVKITHGAAVLLGLAAASTRNWHLVAVAIVIWMMGTREERIARYWHYDGEEPQIEVLGRNGDSQGWFDPNGRPSNNSGPLHSKAPYSNGNHEQRIYRTNDGTFVVVKKIQW